jgi:co-chaperonin GroES (HSP10)
MKTVSAKKPPAKTSFLPLHDRVLLDTPSTAAEEKKEKIIGGIVIPANLSNPSMAQIDNPHIKCSVIAVGPDCKNVQRGDRVVVRKIDCFVCQLDEVEYVMIRESAIVARFI